jgi:hypothetical protein
MRLPSFLRSAPPPAAPSAPAASVSPDDVVRRGAQEGRFGLLEEDSPIRRQDLDLDQNLVTQIRTLLAQH